MNLIHSEKQHNGLHYSILSSMKYVCSHKNLFLTIILLAIVVLGGGVVSQANAQSLIDLPGSSPLSVNVTPEFPRPGQQVTITLESFGVDLQRSRIDWYVNGIKAQGGIASDRFDIIAGSSGTSQEVDIVVTTVTGSTVSKSVTIQSGDVEILWQSKSYTPPFYKGKALYPIQGDLVIVAMPHLLQNGVELNPSDLVYSWKKNGTVQQAESGYGKQTLRIGGGLGSKSISFEVTVSSRNSKAVGVASIEINTVNPQVLLYENNLSNGIMYNRALSDNIRLESPEIRLMASPYFFTTNELHSPYPLSFRWG